MQHREIVKPFVYEKISLEEVREEERAKRRSASDSWGTIKRVWGYLAEKKLFLGLVLFMVLISSAMSLLGPYLVGFSIDEFIEQKQVDGLLSLLIIFRNRLFIPFTICLFTKLLDGWNCTRYSLSNPK